MNGTTFSLHTEKTILHCCSCALCLSVCLYLITYIRLIRYFWVIQKTRYKFSRMTIDQAHEQHNELVKGSGGAIGLTENPVAFRRWMIAGPAEQARLLRKFEDDFLDDVSEVLEHHEEGYFTQETFNIQVLNLCETIDKWGIHSLMTTVSYCLWIPATVQVLT